MKRKEFWRRGLVVLLVLALGFALNGCGDNDDDDGDGGGGSSIESRFATSLHGTRAGKEAWFGDTDGFGSVVSVEYGDLPCVNCHNTQDQGRNDGDPAEGSFTDSWSGEPNCLDCHDGEPDKGNVAMPDTCLGCHGRQATEISLGLTDYHMDVLGEDCMFCHSLEDMHGDGNAYTTMFEPGAVDARCENCHSEDNLLGLNDFHNTTHMDNIDCSACHMTTALACYNCHFDNEGIDDGSVTHAKFASAKFGNPSSTWRFLVNRVIDDQGHTKIYPGSMQSLMADATSAEFPGDDGQGATFVAIGPYYSHSIQKNAITCEDCHASAAMQQYVDEGTIDVVRWKADEGVEVPVGEMGATWQPPRGVIPVPPDYDQALKFDFVDLVNPDAPLTPTGTSSSARVLFKRGADIIHLLDEYVQPLSAEQMNRLGWFNTSLHGTRNGKDTFYNDGIDEVSPDLYQQGFGNFVNIAYTALPCADCHNGADDGTWDGITGPGFEDTYPGNPVCQDCHGRGVESPPADSLVANDTCRGCHGRLAAEKGKGMTDVHLDGLGFACTDCHGLGDIHGVAGTEPDSLFTEGALTADCQECHDLTASTTLEHQEHMGNIDCSTCHMQSVVTCYNCHFDNEAVNDGTVFHGKFASAQFGGTPESGKSWRFLVNRVLDDQGTTMVYPGSMQTLVADVTSSDFPGEDGQGESFVAIAPYYAHAITRTGALGCLDCHGTQNAVDIAGGTPVQVVGWGAGEGVAVPAAQLGATWQAPSGIIPVPADLSLLKFDFVDLVSPESGPASDRVFFESGPDHFHLLEEYVQPLSGGQLDSLAFLHNQGANCAMCHPMN